MSTGIFIRGCKNQISHINYIANNCPNQKADGINNRQPFGKGLFSYIRRTKKVQHHNQQEDGCRSEKVHIGEKSIYRIQVHQVKKYVGNAAPGTTKTSYGLKKARYTKGCIPYYNRVDNSSK